MIIGCRCADACRALVVRHFSTKIIKWEDLDLTGVGCSGILVRRRYREPGLGVTQSGWCQDYATSELITRCGGSGDAGGVLSQPNARRNGGAGGGEELDASCIGRSSDVLGGNSDAK
jgi:hypothetical protein